MEYAFPRTLLPDENGSHREEEEQFWVSATAFDHEALEIRPGEGSLARRARLLRVSEG